MAITVATYPAHHWSAALPFMRSQLQRPDELGLPGASGEYPQYDVTRHSRFPLLPQDVEIMRAGIAITYVALVIDKSYRVSVQDPMTGRTEMVEFAPTWIPYWQAPNCAIKWKWGRLNPLSLEHDLRLSLEPEWCEIGGRRECVQSFVDTLHQPWNDGWPTNPFNMHNSEARVRQAGFVMDPRYDISTWVLGASNEPFNVAAAFWVGKQPAPRRVRGVSKGFETLGVGMGAGEEIRQQIARARSIDQFEGPIALVRYFPITPQTAARLEITTQRPYDAQPAHPDWMTGSGAPVVTKKALKF